MGFLGRIIKPLVENAFDRWTSEEMQKRLKEQDEKASKTLALGSTIESFINIGPMASVMRGGGTAADAARKELGNILGSAFAPILSDIGAAARGWETLFSDFYYENRLGGLIGESIGQIGGFILGLYLPGPPGLWGDIFGWLGNTLGTFIQGWEDPIHPDIPGSPGEIIPIDPYEGLPEHAREYINDMPTTPYIPTPESLLAKPPLRIQMYYRRQQKYVT